MDRQCNGQEEQTVVYRTLHRKLNIEEHESYNSPGCARRAYHNESFLDIKR